MYMTDFSELIKNICVISIKSRPLKLPIMQKFMIKTQCNSFMLLQFSYLLIRYVTILKEYVNLNFSSIGFLYLLDTITSINHFIDKIYCIKYSKFDVYCYNNCFNDITVIVIFTRAVSKLHFKRHVDMYNYMQRISVFDQYQTP